MKALVFLTSCLLVAGCSVDGQVSGEPFDARSVLPGVIVEATWLQKNMATAEVLVIDVRPTEQYLTGHIPGAVSLPVGHIDGQGDGKDMLASIPKIESIFGGLGIRMDQPVVVYDDAIDHRPSARMFWALEVHGHPETGVLNGGLPAWQAVTSQPLQITAPTLEPTAFVAVLQPSRLATQLQVLRASAAADSLILDVRSLPEYVGEKSDGARKGHIDGAEHRDYSTNFNIEPTSGTCRLLSLDQLRVKYYELSDDKPIIAYCNSGTHASVTYLALRALGRDVSVYDGGWFEWSANPRLPIQSGPKP